MTIVRSKLSRRQGKNKPRRAIGYSSIGGAVARSARICQSENILYRISRFRSAHKFSARFHPPPSLRGTSHSKLESESSNPSRQSPRAMANPAVITTGAVLGNHHGRHMVRSVRHLLCALLRARGGACPIQHREMMIEVAQWMMDKVEMWTKEYWNSHCLCLERCPLHGNRNRNLYRASCTQLFDTNRRSRKSRDRRAVSQANRISVTRLRIRLRPFGDHKYRRCESEREQTAASGGHHQRLDREVPSVFDKTHHFAKPSPRPVRDHTTWLYSREHFVQNTSSRIPNDS